MYSTQKLKIYCNFNFWGEISHFRCSKVLISKRFFLEVFHNILSMSFLKLEDKIRHANNSIFWWDNSFLLVGSITASEFLKNFHDECFKLLENRIKGPRSRCWSSRSYWNIHSSLLCSAREAAINSFFGGQSIFSIEQIHRDVIGFWNVMIFCMVEVLRLSCKIFFKVILFFWVLLFAHFFIEWFGTDGHFNGFRNSDFLWRGWFRWLNSRVTLNFLVQIKIIEIYGFSLFG